MNEPAPRESVENPSQPEPNLRLVPPPSPAAPFPPPPHSLRLRVVGAWLRTLGLALAGLLMVVAAFASIMNLNRVKGLVQEMGQSREILVRLECAENDLLMLDTFAHVPVPSAAERQQAQQRRQHLDGELRQIAGLTDGNVEMRRMWGGLREEFEHALRLLDDAARNHNHATLHGRAVTHNFDMGFERIHDKVAHLELISAHQWRERTQGMIAWMGASGVATGVAASLGLALLLVLGIVLHRLTRMLESRVRQRTAQLEASIRGNREAQQRLEIAIEGTGIGFWEWNVRENIIRWDAKMFRLYGLEPTSDGIVPYEAWRSAVHPEDVAAQEERLQLTAATMGHSAREFRIHRHDDGELRILAANEKVRMDADGLTVWVVGTNLDITEQRNQEAELRRFSAELEQRVDERTAESKAATRRLQDIQHALDEHAIVDISDAQGRMIYVNDRMCEISKYSREELLGHDHRLFNSGMHPRAVFADLWETVNTGRIWRHDVCNRAKDGTYFWVHTTIVPMLDETGRPHQFVVIRDDITAMRQAQDELEAMNLELANRKRDLERSNTELEQFAYVASHDLQEPLRAVSGCVQMLQARLKGKVDPTSEELAHHAVDGAARMHALIQSLLQYSRVGTRAAEMVPVESEEVLETAITDLGEAIRESGAHITHDPMPRVIADAGQLHQVFQNLIGNAVKFREIGRASCRERV